MPVNYGASVFFRGPCMMQTYDSSSLRRHGAPQTEVFEFAPTAMELKANGDACTVVKRCALPGGRKCFANVIDVLSEWPKPQGRQRSGEDMPVELERLRGGPWAELTVELEDDGSVLEVWAGTKPKGIPTIPLLVVQISYLPSCRSQG